MALLLGRIWLSCWDIFEPSHLEKDEDMALLLDILESLLEPLFQVSHHIPVIPGQGLS
jgi:hypothetical protein